ncbi:hypothetical protein [Brevibacillus brevis]|uniref:Uncharacterized protein n=1 Tax=Brevibacillus brevis TaxID=1393 RepID=A0ABY9TBF9_BREBE|nr:hypothetical protein [Brevibacillus brevis]WNC17445.1 hypothetical protein RGB73_14400 [Brevibacillus brevis]
MPSSSRTCVGVLYDLGVFCALRRQQADRQADCRARCENHVSKPPAGGSMPHNNMQPFTVLHFIICLNGEYPIRS